MGFFSNFKEFILNQSDMYRFYKNEYEKNKKVGNLKKTNKKINKLEKEFKIYKRDTDRVLNSYNSLFNSLFIYHDVKPKELVKLSHELTLEMLDFIDNVCKKHNLQWWMYAGTLLGAVRHGGYIPWDDDLDINMMREDYEKFLKIFPKEISECGLTDKVTITTSKITATGIYLAFIKIEYWFNTENLSFIDIFPTDYVTDVIDDFESVRKNTRLVMLDKFKSGEDRQVCLNEAFEKLHVTPDKTDILIEGIEDQYCLIYNAKQIFPLKSLKFEDRYYPCPNDYISYLIEIYGEGYNKVPKTAFAHDYYEYLSGHENVLSKFKDAISILHEVNEKFDN